MNACLHAAFKSEKFAIDGDQLVRTVSNNVIINDDGEEVGGRKTCNNNEKAQENGQQRLLEEELLVNEVVDYIQHVLLLDLEYSRVCEATNSQDCPIYCSKGWDTAARVLLVLQNSPGSKPGVWSRSSCLTDGLNVGSMLPLLTWAKHEGYGVVIFNPNTNYTTTTTTAADGGGGKERIKGSGTPVAHVASVWNWLKQSFRRDVDLFLLTFAGGVSLVNVILSDVYNGKMVTSSSSLPYAITMKAMACVEATRHEMWSLFGGYDGAINNSKVACTQTRGFVFTRTVSWSHYFADAAAGSSSSSANNDSRPCCCMLMNSKSVGVDTMAVALPAIKRYFDYVTQVDKAIQTLPTVVDVVQWMSFAQLGSMFAQREYDFTLKQRWVASPPTKAVTKQAAIPAIACWGDDDVDDVPVYTGLLDMPRAIAAKPTWFTRLQMYIAHLLTVNPSTMTTKGGGSGRTENGKLGVWRGCVQVIAATVPERFVDDVGSCTDVMSRTSVDSLTSTAPPSPCALDAMADPWAVVRSAGSSGGGSRGSGGVLFGEDLPCAGRNRGSCSSGGGGGGDVLYRWSRDKDCAHEGLAAAGVMVPTVFDFELLCVIGKGAFGDVFECRKKEGTGLGSGKVFALKRISKEMIYSTSSPSRPGTAGSAAGGSSVGVSGAVDTCTPAPMCVSQPDTSLLKCAMLGGTHAQRHRTTKRVKHAQQERAILCKLRHPFLLQLQFAFESPTALYLATNLYTGGSIFHHLRAAGGAFDESRVRFYGGQILLALEYLHKTGIVYRDLKPENICIDADGYIGIVDFGLSTLRHHDPCTCRDRRGGSGGGGGCDGGSKGACRLSYTYCGTPEYLSPEIVGGRGYGAEVDLWAFGCLVFEMLVGRSPFYAKSRRDIFRQIIRAQVNFPTGGSPHQMQREQSCSHAAVSLVQGLLKQKARERTTLEAVRDKSEFFRNMQWDQLLRKEITPPFVPNRKAHYFKSRPLPADLEENDVIIDSGGGDGGGGLTKHQQWFDKEDFVDFSFVSEALLEVRMDHHIMDIGYI